jgi:hypothetical protein
MTTFNISNVQDELVIFLRNQDVFTITDRGVTTTTDTGTFTGATSHKIAVTNIKNIRSIVVASVTLTFGTDYTVDYDFLDTTIKTKVTFIAPQTGVYTITYDYGADKIFPDYPRPDLTLSSYPRITVDIMSMDNRESAIGGGLITTNVMSSITVYAGKTKDVNDYITTIRTKIIANKKNFYYFKFITPVGLGPLIKSPDRNDKIMQRTIDLLLPLNFEE